MYGPIHAVIALRTARGAAIRVIASGDRSPAIQTLPWQHGIGAMADAMQDFKGVLTCLQVLATEAGRTGAAGRGRALALAEMKALAERTERATERIGGQIAAPWRSRAP